MSSSPLRTSRAADLPAPSVGTFLCFQASDGAVVQPPGRDRSHQRRGVPDRRVDRAFECSDESRWGYHESEAKARSHALGQPRDVECRFRRERCQWSWWLFHQIRVRGVLDDEKSVLAGNRHQSSAGLLGSDPPKRVVQRRHRVNRSDPPRDAQLSESVQIRSVCRCGQRHQLQAERFGEHLESGIGQRINRNHVSGLQHRQRRDGQPVLCAADDQHLIRGDQSPRCSR